ncbi:MAG TPA: hypothetical protein VHN58_03025 [Croceicoccus sp.]|nr:hypothetical protein [Croceicoccus sp.]
MVDLIQANWVAFAIVVALAAIIVLWLLTRPKKERIRSHRPDVLDEGVGPARRNQALIDSAPAAGAVTHEHEPPLAPEGMAGLDIAIGAAALAHDERMHHLAEKGAEKDAGSNGAPEDQMPANADDAQAVAAAIKIDAADHADDARTGTDRAGDDLSRIKGLGPKLMAMLGDMGISSFDQIAAWNDDDVQRIDAQLGRFAGRITRDDWRTQAQYLAKDDIAGYEERFGKL